MLSTMMKSLMHKEWRGVSAVLQKINVCKQDNVYDCCFGSECHKSFYDEEDGLEMCDEVIYTLNENYMELCNQTATCTEYRYCTVNAIKPRWEFLAENGYTIQEVIEFTFKHTQYVRMVIHLPCNYDDHPIDISRIEFAFGKITFGISYIIPLYVWNQYQSEIDSLFTYTENITMFTSHDNGDWEKVLPSINIDV